MASSTTNTASPRFASLVCAPDFDAEARADIVLAIDAVCDELGFGRTASERRDAVATGVVTTWRHGRRHPLNLVHAGLEAVGA